MCLEGFDGFVASTAASIASGWSDPVNRAGLAPAGKTLPYHGAQYIYINITACLRAARRSRFWPEMEATSNWAVGDDRPGCWRRTRRRGDFYQMRDGAAA